MFPVLDIYHLIMVKFESILEYLEQNMQLFPQTILLRHRKENLNKCSLRGLESRPDCLFLTYPQSTLPDLSSHILLSIDAQPLTLADAHKGILILDGTWRYADKMLRWVEGQSFVEKRSLPFDLRTAYPRRQEDCSDPERGLASVEALYAAYAILNRDTAGLLDNYHWRELFLSKNPCLTNTNALR